MGAPIQEPLGHCPIQIADGQIDAVSQKRTRKFAPDIAAADESYR